jgi:hypothetical protein
MDIAAPAVSSEAFDRLRALADSAGPVAAADALIEELSDGRDPTALFYAQLLKARVEFGVSPFPSGSSSDVPAEFHERYETAIREAARRVGTLLLDRGDIVKAWPFFKLIGEQEPVKLAIEAFAPGEEDDICPLIDVAWQQGVHPHKGFDLLLSRQGICSSITMVGSTNLSHAPDLRDYCIGKLVGALHEQLNERVHADLAQRGRPASMDAPLASLLTDDLFADDAYHIDISHLQSVVQMATQLSAGPTLDMARELCAYGCKLSPNLKGHGGDPPFDESYDDYAAFLSILAGDNVDANLERFRKKAAAGAAEGMTYPAEVLVNLLVRIGRDREAMDALREFLKDANPAEMSCPNLVDLARKTNDFESVALAARDAGDPVTFLAGVIAGRKLKE